MIILTDIQNMFTEGNASATIIVVMINESYTVHCSDFTVCATHAQNVLGQLVTGRHTL